MSELNKKKLETYSYSKVKMFYSCKQAFYTRYFERPTELLNHGTSEFGSFMHEILEKYEKGELEIYDMLPYYIEHYNDAVKSSFVLNINANFSKDFSDNYYIDGIKYLENFEGFPQFNILEVEHEFEVNIEDKFLFNGKIDLIARNNDGELIILDHKSKSKFKNKKELNEYAKQLYLYAYAVKQEYGELPKKLYFNMFRTNELVEIDFDINDYQNAYNWLVSSVNEIENTFDFSPQENEDPFYCLNFCPVKNQCEYINN